jgi:hypothetical protein
VNTFLNLPNPFSFTMALGFTEPLTEMSIDLSGGKMRLARKADNLTANYEPIVETMWDPRHLTTI